jgi:ammonia channel protein AmtB
MNKNIRTWRRIINIALVVALFVFSTQTALAQETMEVVSAINTVWVLFAAFLILKRTIGLRVSPEVELGGLDLAYHGIESYPKFDNKDLQNPQKGSSRVGTPIPAPSGD